MNDLETAWQNTWQNLAGQNLTALGEGAFVFERLIEKYSEPHRHYHTLQHLKECLALFDKVKELTDNSIEIAFALWFHDAIYDVFRSDNELKSAHWAIAELARLGITDARANRVFDLILATQHSVSPQSPAEQLLVDIDLAILGAEADRFAEYERQIQAEYTHVPGWLFRRKRRKILQGFLNRDTIYTTDYFIVRYEQKARENLWQVLG